MNWDVFTPMSATIGGALIGVSASIVLLCHGRIAGISGILGGVFRTPISEMSSRFAFIGGLIVGGVILSFVYPDAFIFEGGRELSVVIPAGVIVGFGTQLGSGCTSGHGVCGLSRLSFRSLVATMMFMGFGFATASGFGLAFGG